MSDLPEIKFSKKKEKRGFLPWLRQKLGLNPAGGAPGAAGISSQASNAANLANAGRAFGAAKIGGASTGFMGGILAGKGALIATAAIVAGTVGAGLYMSGQSPTVEKPQSAFSSDKTEGSAYVPAILRQKKHGSSLAMFKDTNEGILGDEAAKGSEVKDDSAKSGEAPEAPEGQPAPGNGDGKNMANDMMAKLMGGGMGDLTKTMGGGSNKFSGMGGFGNKFGSGQIGPKVGVSNNVGAGFQDLPKFKARRKALAMKAGKRALISKQAAGKKGKYGKGAHNQAKGVSDTQKSYTSGKIDGLRSTQDAAWEGTTDGGVSTGGSGLGSGDSSGGSGIVTSPSLDDGGAGGGGSTGDVPDTSIPAATSPEDVSPWASLASQCMMLLLLSAVLSAIGSAFVKASYTATGTIFGAPAGAVLYAIGIGFCVVAALAAVAALVMGLQIMTEHGQTMLGMIYMIGSGCAIAAAFMGMAGLFGMSTMFSPMWMAAAAGVIAMIGSMMSTSG